MRYHNHNPDIVTINREDSSKPDANPTRYGTMGYWHEPVYRPMQPTRRAALLDYRAILAAGFVLLVFALLLWYWIDNAISSFCLVRYRFCNAASYVLPVLLLSVPVLALLLTVLYIVARIQALYADVRQRNVARDRFGNIVPLHVYDRMSAEQILERTAKELLLATELKKITAPYEKYNGINTLSEGNNESVTTEIATPTEPEPRSLLPAAGKSMMQDLIDRGYIRFSDNSLFIGLGDGLEGKPISLRWSSANAGLEPIISAVAGLMGSGKSYLARFLIAQAVAKNLQVVVCDPNLNSDQSIMRGIDKLATRFALPVAAEPHDITNAVDYVYTKLEDRRTGLDTDTTGLLLVIDEFTSVVLSYANRDHIIQRLALIGANGRHFGVRVILIGQAWRAGLFGDNGGTFRNLISLAVIGNSNPREVDFLTYGLDSKLKAQLAMIAPPEMFVAQHGTLTKVVVASTDADLVQDTLAIAQRFSRALPPVVVNALADTTGGSSSNEGTPDDNEVTDEVTASERDTAASLPVTMTPVEAAKIALLLQSLPPSDVAKRLDGYSPRRYSEYKAKVEAVQVMLTAVE